MKRVIFFLLILFCAAPAASEVYIDSHGTYVGGLPSFYDSDSMISGTPAISQDGVYSDGTPHKIDKKEIWQNIAAAIDVKLSVLESEKNKE